MTFLDFMRLWLKALKSSGKSNCLFPDVQTRCVGSQCSCLPRFVSESSSPILSPLLSTQPWVSGPHFFKIIASPSWDLMWFGWSSISLLHAFISHAPSQPTNQQSTSSSLDSSPCRAFSFLICRSRSIIFVFIPAYPLHGHLIMLAVVSFRFWEINSYVLQCNC